MKQWDVNILQSDPTNVILSALNIIFLQIERFKTLLYILKQYEEIKKNNL